MKPLEKFLLPLVFEILWLVLQQVGSGGRMRLARPNRLFCCYLSVNSPSFGLQIRYTCGLPTVIVVEEIIPLHELLCIDLHQGAIH